MHNWNQSGSLGDFLDLDRRHLQTSTVIAIRNIKFHLTK